MFVKICGITNIQDAYACVESGADAIGLNFFRKSKRFISFDEAAAIVREVSPYVTTVGIMVQPTIEDITIVIEATEVDALQIYEPRFAVADFDLKKLLYYSVQVKSEEDIKTASHLGADLIFLDSFTQGEFGGTGKTSDWDMLANSGVDLSTRFVLSGGLTSDNVCDAIRKLRPYGVDTASGVELSPGKKDHKKIKDFISNAKQCSDRG